MKHLITLLLLITFSVSGLAQDRVKKNMNPVKEDGNNVIVPSVIKYGNPLRGTYPNGTVITGADGFFDYATNGKSMSNIWVYGDTIIISYFIADSTDPNGATTRMANYVVSVNGGTSWSAPNAFTTLPTRSAYPDLCPYIGGTGRSMSMSGRLYAPAGSRGGAFTDAFFNLGSITGTNVPNNGRDYFSHYLNGDFIGGVSSIPDGGSSDTLNYWRFNIATNTFTASTVVVAPGSGIADNVRYQTVADETGNNVFVMWWNSVAGSEGLNMRTSSDGGGTWGTITTLQQAFSTNGVIGGDTCSPWFGYDAMYKPGTSDIYAVWSTLFPTGTGQTAGNPQGDKILIWSPGLNGGTPVEVAGRNNMNIIADTNLLFPALGTTGGLQVGVTPVSHPSIGFNSDGSVLTCVFSAYQPLPDTLDGFVMNDIYYTYSTDNGATWQTPVNLTNTPTWDELYPVVSPTGNIGNNFNIHYQATRGPGSQSFTDNAPVYRVYQVYDKLSTVSIQNISSEIPDGFSLKQNYPNPFNPATSIRFDIAKTSNVTLKIYDATGREVATLLNNQEIAPGTFEYNFNAESLSSGIYFYTLQSDNLSETKKMMLLK